MKLRAGVPIVVCLFMASCSRPTTETDTRDSAPPAASSATTSGQSGAAGGAAAGTAATPTVSDTAAVASVDFSGLTPVPVESGVVPLTPENSKIQFVGTHVGPNPDPNARVGVFQQFSGELQIAPSGQQLEGVVIEIQTESIWTPIDKLTNHLKGADFLEVREFPTITFQSTQVSADANDPSQYTITGDLTLHGETKQVAIPAKVQFNNDGVVLRSQFTVDRTEFGMNYGPEQVEKNVALTVTVGEKTDTQALAAGPGPGGPGGGGQGGGRGNFDPAQFFAQRDTDGDGKLSGDEMPDRMRQDLDQIDTDGDGAVSQDEFQQRMQAMRASGGFGRGPGGPGAGGPPGAGQPQQ